MALIKCTECSKEISDKAVSCPSCGYNPPQDITIVETNIKRTEIGEKAKAFFVRNIIIGSIVILLGAFFLVWAIAVLPSLISGDGGTGSIIIVLILFLLAVVFLTRGITEIANGYRHAICPYCGNKALIARKNKNLVCEACNKTSVRKGNYLETVHD